MAQAQCDGVLLPLMALNRADEDAAAAAASGGAGALRQARLDSFYMSYHDDNRVARIRSKRLRHAVGGIKNAPTVVAAADTAETEEEEVAATPPSKKRAPAKKKKQPVPK